MLTIALLMVGGQALAQSAHVDLVAQTPCLEEYRAWFFSFRRPERFPQPPQFTHEQCAEAAKVHERIAEEQAQEAEATKRRLAEEEQADGAERLRRLGEMQQAAARLEKLRADQAKRPGVRLGMRPADVLNRTHWGAPLTVNRTTTAAGVREQWVYSSKHYLYFTNGVLTAIQD